MQITQNCCDISKGWNEPHVAIVVACLVLLGSTELLPSPFAAFPSLLSCPDREGSLLLACKTSKTSQGAACGNSVRQARGCVLGGSVLCWTCSEQWWNWLEQLKPENSAFPWLVFGDVCMCIASYSCKSWINANSNGPRRKSASLTEECKAQCWSRILFVLGSHSWYVNMTFLQLQQYFWYVISSQETSVNEGRNGLRKLL